jgi:hypothetical protein
MTLGAMNVAVKLFNAPPILILRSTLRLTGHDPIGS